MLAVHLTYYAWDSDRNGRVTKADLAAGRIPLVNWSHTISTSTKIVNDSLDATITALASGAKALTVTAVREPARLLFRFRNRHEPYDLAALSIAKQSFSQVVSCYGCEKRRRSSRHS